MAEPTGWRTILDGAHTSLFLRSAAAEPAPLCITFDALDAPHRPPYVPLDTLIARRGAAHAHVSTRRNDWYHNPDLPALRAALHRLGERHDGVVLYGSSMGGYGALLLSAAAGADRVVAIVPQYCVQPHSPPFEPRWAELARHIDFGDRSLADVCSPTAEKLIVYDPGLKEDAAHAALLRRLPNTRPVLTPGSGHYPLQFLHQAGLLHDVLDELLFGAPDFGKLSRWRRQGRAGSSRYLCQLAMWLARRNEVGGACRALSRAVAANPQGPEAIEGAITALCAFAPQDVEGLILLALRYLETRHPELTQYQPMLAQYEARLGKRASKPHAAAISDLVKSSASA